MQTPAQKIHSQSFARGSLPNESKLTERLAELRKSGLTVAAVKVQQELDALRWRKEQDNG